MNLAIFDIDGTLTNTNSVDNECFVKALAEAHGITGVNTNWAEYPHTTDSGIMLHIFLERFGRVPEAKELAEFKQSFVDLLNEQYRSNSSLFAEISGAGSALNRLRQESDWRVAIATGCWRESASLKLAAAGLEIDGIPAAYAEDGLSREEIVQAALLKALDYYRQSNFERVVSVGDGLWDVRAARALDLAFLGIGTGEYETMLRQAGAKHVIEDLADCRLLIRCLNEAATPKVERV